MILNEKELTRLIRVALRDAYQRGWEDARTALFEAAGKNEKRPRSKAPRLLKDASRTIDDLVGRVTAREAIMQALEANPRLQSSEIFRWAEEKGMAIEFDAVRQAISRLMKKGTLIKHGDGYALNPARTVK